MHSSAFSDTRIKLFRVSNGLSNGLIDVLQEFQEKLFQISELSNDRADCFIALCRIVKNASHRKVVLHWIGKLVSLIGREHRVFSELVVEFFEPLLAKPLIHEEINREVACDILKLLANPRTAALVVSAYCDLYFSPSDVKFRLKSDVAQLNKISLCIAIDLDEANLDNEIAYWLS